MLPKLPVVVVVVAVLAVGTDHLLGPGRLPVLARCQIHTQRPS